MAIRQITIIGTGLIGGSVALALKKNGFAGTIMGCDRAVVLSQARSMGAIDLACEDPAEAARGSDLVVLATPVGAILDTMERVGPLLPAGTLMTDVGSTKGEVATRAQSVFGQEAKERFLPGHPMAGKEHGGIGEADAGLFQQTVWIFTPVPGQRIEETGTAPAKNNIDEWTQWVQRFGARIVTLDAARHDLLCAWVSHLPQMLSTALAAALYDQFGEDAELQAIGGRALREMTRIAGSPYSMWRDIALTNTGNIQDALLRLEQRLANLRENLGTRELEHEFQTAHKIKKS